MQFYANKNRLPLKTTLFFTVVLFIAYLPVSSFLFFLKNDAFTGYFPPKFFISESIHAGHLPLWNPYINFGIPQYGDMSSGYWSPITWLIASTVGYNAYTFTLEVLLYILLGGIGMYKLIRQWHVNKQVSIIAAVAFMCCGYNTGHLQHFNWLSGTAFLPWCFWSYCLLLNNACLKNILRAVLSFYLLVTSAHPGITISILYFFTAYFIFYFFENKAQSSISERLKKAGTSHILFIVLFLLLSAGMICGYLDILPHFIRGEKISLQDALLQPTTAQSWISVLLPFATVKNDAFFNTDVSMRNSYFSIGLLLFFLLSLFNKKNKLQLFLLSTGLFFTLVASGGIFKTIAYKVIPLMGYVRLNGEFSILAIFCFIIIAAIELNNYIKAGKNFNGVIKAIYYCVEIITITVIAIGFYKVTGNKEGVLYNFQQVSAQPGLSSKIKSLLDAISFYDTLWIQGLIQLFVLWGVKYSLRFSNWNLLKNIVVIDMIIACLLNIPFTGVGKASVSQVQQVLNKSPKGIPIPKLIPVINNDTSSAEDKLMVGDWSFYNKQPGVISQAAYPIILKKMQAYFDMDPAFNKTVFNEKPFIFSTDSGNNNILIQSFSPQEIQVTVNSNAAANLVLQQNFYPHWYYKIGEETKTVNEYKTSFMSAPLQQGNNTIRFIFEPTRIKWAMFFSALVLLIYCLILVIPGKEATKN